MTIKVGDESHPDSLEVIASYPDWAERNERLIGQPNEVLRNLGNFGSLDDSSIRVKAKRSLSTFHRENIWFHLVFIIAMKLKFNPKPKLHASLDKTILLACLLNVYEYYVISIVLAKLVKNVSEVFLLIPLVFIFSTSQPKTICPFRRRLIANSTFPFTLSLSDCTLAKTTHLDTQSISKLLIRMDLFVFVGLVGLNSKDRLASCRWEGMVELTADAKSSSDCVFGA